MEPRARLTADKAVASSFCTAPPQGHAAVRSLLIGSLGDPRPFEDPPTEARAGHAGGSSLQLRHQVRRTGAGVTIAVASAARHDAWMRVTLLPVLLWLSSCAPAVTAPAASATRAEQKALTPPANAATCPARYGERGPTCMPGDFPSCSYPEGDCFCGDEPRCSGAVQEPRPPHWVCVPRRKPCPAAGTPCTGPGVCAPPCCGSGVACVNGTWTAQLFPCPP